MNYYISDTHFGHNNIVRLDVMNGCRNFLSIEEHDGFIIDNWNRIVKPNDNVYILGDFSWLNANETEKLIKRLNGNKFLIKGNHDSWCNAYNCRKLFKDIYDYKVVNDNGYRVVLFHYPILFYQYQHKNSILLYGHVHNTREEQLFQDACKDISEKTDIPMNCYNVGCMHWNYTPVTLKEILEREINNEKTESKK